MSNRVDQTHIQLKFGLCIIAPIVLKRIQVIGTIIWKCSPKNKRRCGRSFGSPVFPSGRSGRSKLFASNQMETAFRRLRRSRQSKTMPEYGSFSQISQLHLFQNGVACMSICIISSVRCQLFAFLKYFSSP